MECHDDGNVVSKIENCSYKGSSSCWCCIETSSIVVSYLSILVVVKEKFFFINAESPIIEHFI